MEKRIGVIGIVVEDRKKVARQINQTLSEFAAMIRGRMGIPFADREISTISLIVEGTPDQVSSLTGKLGNLQGVTLKSALTSHIVTD
ncbi:MAG: TM1266 family iron-only hydrogenase system putative regulator [Halanaerobiaceae bacterium]